MITYTGANKILTWFTGKSESANSLYVGLSSTEPTVAGANVTEPTVSSYKRVAVATKESSSLKSIFDSPVNGLNGSSITNKEQVLFQETYNNATKTVEDWGELSYICLFSAATGGSLLAYQALETPIHPGANGESSIPIIRIGDATIEITNPTA
jgi:hypothetical protein